jgi:hypothetical protein
MIPIGCALPPVRPDINGLHLAPKAPARPADDARQRRPGVQRLIACCLNPSCQHEGLIDVSKFADDVGVTSLCPELTEKVQEALVGAFVEWRSKGYSQPHRGSFRRITWTP